MTIASLSKSVSLVTGYRTLAIMFAAAFISSGCIPAPSSVAIDQVTLTKVENPTGKPTVYISKVTDLRQFTADNSEPSIPNMITAADVSNPTIKLQTVGIYHKTNVTLQPGQTVETIVTEAIANGLRAKGYTVVAPGTDGIPVEADIVRCWMWAGRGDMGLKMKTMIEINLKSPLNMNGPDQTVDAEYEINTPFTTVSIGLATVDDALDALSKNMQPVIKAP